MTLLQLAPVLVVVVCLLGLIVGTRLEERWFERWLVQQDALDRVVALEDELRETGQLA